MPPIAKHANMRSPKHARQLVQPSIGNCFYEDRLLFCLPSAQNSTGLGVPLPSYHEDDAQIVVCNGVFLYY